MKGGRCDSSQVKETTKRLHTDSYTRKSSYKTQQQYQLIICQQEQRQISVSKMENMRLGLSLECQ